MTPSASGSAYLELESPSASITGVASFKDIKSGVKLSCTVHGPRPLPRSAPFTPRLLLSTYVKFAPFATRQRRGYIRDASERDLSAHLETALSGVIIGERWPKSGVDIIITVLEGEEEHRHDEEKIRGEDGQGANGNWSMMSILSTCITVASAALADAGIDCVDLVCGGMAAIVQEPNSTISKHHQATAPTQITSETNMQIVLDPCILEHHIVLAACVVGYLQSRDEITEIWAKSDALTSTVIQGSDTDEGHIGLLMDKAAEAAKSARLVLVEAINESTDRKLRRGQTNMESLAS